MSQKSRKDAAGATPSQPLPQTPPAPPAPPPARRGLLVAAAAAAVVAVAGGFLYLNQRARSTQAAALAASGRVWRARTRRRSAMPAPRCRSSSSSTRPARPAPLFYPLVKQMMADNPGRIRLAIRHVAFHKGSATVVAMLEASRKQDKYWQTLEALLARPGRWVLNHTAEPELARQAIAGVGLDMDAALRRHGGAGSGAAHGARPRRRRAAEGHQDAGVFRQWPPDAEFRPAAVAATWCADAMREAY